MLIIRMHVDYLHGCTALTGAKAHFEVLIYRWNLITEAHLLFRGISYVFLQCCTVHRFHTFYHASPDLQAITHLISSQHQPPAH
jgi:hypothetical protein